LLKKKIDEGSRIIKDHRRCIVYGCDIRISTEFEMRISIAIEFP